MHKTDILWAQPSSGGVADQFSKKSPKLRKIYQVLCNSSAVEKTLNIVKGAQHLPCP